MVASSMNRRLVNSISMVSAQCILIVTGLIATWFRSRSIHFNVLLVPQSMVAG